MTTLTEAAAPLSPPPVPAPAPAPVLPRVSIADRVARAFPPLACVRGFRYFARKKVELLVLAKGEVNADVKGKRVQHVRLRLEEGKLATACTCSAKTLGPAACRHVWATLLEVDRRGELAALRATPRSLALAILDAPKPKPAPARAARTRAARGSK